MHRGSSWDEVATVLEFHGHRVVAPDLPVDDDAAGAWDWATAAVDALRRVTHPMDDDVIVVGHSLTGLCLPVIGARRRVRRLVFLAALVPVPGETFADHLSDNPDALCFVTAGFSGDGPFGLSWESIREGFYHDCPEALARRAFDDLRGQAFTVFTERCPIDRWPDVPSTYILMRDDRAVGAGWAHRTVTGLPETDLIEMDGGHCPFFAQPEALAEMLNGFAAPGISHANR
jgi:pimeloyl-ACP methyl ester carboxylesterase